MRRWLAALSVYRDRRILLIFCLGFSSGLPLLLTGGTLTTWLSKVGFDTGPVGLFALVGLPYSIKFLWAPILNSVRVPLLTRVLGQRRGWVLSAQLALIPAIALLAVADPVRAPLAFAALALLVAFLSASQDIVVDAYRIEILEEERQGVGSAAIQIGYRLAMFASGFGALKIAESFGGLERGWLVAYSMMAAFVVVGILAVLFAREPQPKARVDAPRQDASQGPVRAWIKHQIVMPFVDFARHPAWPVILVFILLFKFGDAVAGTVANNFYIKTGFTLSEIAEVSKIFGMFATVGGFFLGGLVVTRFGMLKGLLLCGALQMGSNLMYALQASVGHDVTLLYATIGIENVSGGMGSAAFVAYLSSLCGFGLAATQYALLSSIASIGRVVFSSGFGYVAEALGWVNFFLLSTAIALPGLLVLLWLMWFLRRRAQAAGNPGA